MSRPTQKKLHPTTELTGILAGRGVDVLHGPNQSTHGSENQSGDEAAADFDFQRLFAWHSVKTEGHINHEADGAMLSLPS